MGSRWLVVFLVLCVGFCARGEGVDDGGDGAARVVVVVGAAGLEKYGELFAEWAGDWEAACVAGGVGCEVIGLEGSGVDNADKVGLQKAVEGAVSSGSDLWLVLIGHGTYNGRVAHFNLRGRDVSAAELKEWLGEEGKVAIVNGASASAPFIAKLSGDGRVVVTSTKSGSEQNFARFSGFMAEAIGDVKADLDKDGQTSLLEAYLMAARRVEAYYEEEGLLASEHALIDDNGDGLGTRADFYRGIRPIKKAKAGTPDGYGAHQWHLVKSAQERALPEEVRGERDRLEMEVLRLRDNRGDYGEDEYFRLLEEKLLKLAEIYEGVGG